MLSNGSTIQSLPSSERAIRGASVDLLIVDECSFVTEDVLEGAAIPTTAARPAREDRARVHAVGRLGGVLEVLPGGPERRRRDHHHVPVVAGPGAVDRPEVVEGARRILSPLRFAAEYLGEWVPSGDAYFDHEDIRAAVASYRLMRDGNGMPAMMGLDWGKMQDMSAIVLAGLLDDYGANGRPCIIVPYLQTSRMAYPQQYAEIEAIARGWDLQVVSEVRGVGSAPTDSIALLLNRNTVQGFDSTQQRKEDAYGRVSMLLANRQLVLPDDDELLRQMMGVSGQATLDGTADRRPARKSIHDDLPDALRFAVWGLPRQLADVPARDVPDGVTWTQTPGGIMIPQPYGLVRAEASYLNVNGGVMYCKKCGLPNPPYKTICQYCQHENPDAAPKPVVQPLPVATAVPALTGNWWASDLTQCPQGHKYLAGYTGGKCPKCDGGMTAPGFGGMAMPQAFMRALAIGRR